MATNTNEITVAEFNKFIKAILTYSKYEDGNLNLGNLIELKPIYMQYSTGKSLEGYDIYKYADKELMGDEDYDFDADYICTIYL